MGESTSRSLQILLTHVRCFQCGGNGLMNITVDGVDQRAGLKLGFRRGVSVEAGHDAGLFEIQ